MSTTPPQGNPPAERTPAEKSIPARYMILFLFGIVEIIGIIEIMLLFRLIFSLMGANPASRFVSFVYALTQIFVVPFTDIFSQAAVTGSEKTAVLQPATLVAMVVCAVLAWGIAQIVILLSNRLH